MSIIMKSLDKACVKLLKDLEVESCQPEKISLKLELDYKLANMKAEENIYLDTPTNFGENQILFVGRLNFILYVR